ncbi:MAG: AMP-binding protein [Firmicutes bacterium]|nr:AMP-binding protein [Bacillota bacterium]
MKALLNITMGQMLEEISKKFPKNSAVKYTEVDYSRTYEEFNAEADLYAKGLMSIGIEKGDKVAMWATNYPQWLITMFATAKIGAVLVTVNTNYRIYELEYLLRQSDSKCLVFCDGLKDINCAGIINELCPELKNSVKGKLESAKFPFLKSVVSIDSKHDGMFLFSEIQDFATNISDKEYTARKNSLNPDEVINMQYTSGTTGFPKGVMLTHNNIVNNGNQIGDRMNFSEKDRLLIPVPFFHCFGMVLAILAAVTHGAAMVPLLYYSAVKAMKAIEQEKCTAMHGVPTMFIGILDHPDFNKYDFTSLRTGIMAGSPCPIKIMQDVINKMHASELTIVFGLTESSPGCTQTTVSDSVELRVNTVGRAFDHVETKIIDPETGKTLPPNTKGEFCARGYNIMKGYYKMPEATALAIDKDGWLHSGDLATFNEQGYFKIVGRIKDMIIKGGENVYPKEIEDFIYTHPKIKDVQVVGAPSVKYGEEIAAFIILKDGENMTEEEVKDYVAKNMARQKIPSYVIFIKSLPMTASGKIQKYKLREMVVETFHLSGPDETA